MSPTRSALALAGGYALVAALYVVVSSQVAGGAAATPEELARIEIVKGLLFVAVTGAGLFGLSHFLFTRLTRAMAEAQRRRYALILAERRALVGTFCGSMAHDFRNVMTVVGSVVDGLRDLGLPGEADELLEGLEDTVHRGSDLARRLAAAGADRTVGERRELDLAELVRDDLVLARSHHRVKTTRLNLDAPLSVRAPVYPALIEQIVGNLVINAAEAMDGSGRLEVRVFEDGPDAVLEVHDDGPGIPPARRALLFKPYETTKATGTGLGLVSVQDAAELHGGRVEVEDSPLGGALFRVRLPRHVDVRRGDGAVSLRPPPQTSPAAPPPARRGRGAASSQSQP